jgi:flagellin-like hook-associated protein FlgL
MGATSVASLSVQRNFADASSQLSRTSDALSSGLRINRAADDAAGLSIASDLRMDARVYAQAIRNYNDGISFLSIAESALKELSGVVLRIQELAEQSANGVLADSQRGALDKEAQALREEYNRIVRSAEFNGRSIFEDQGATELILQGGYGEAGQLRLDVGGKLARSYTTPGTFSFGLLLETTGTAPGSFGIADLNGDGNNDIVSGMGTSNQIAVFLGNGDGTFQERQTSASTNRYTNIIFADVNNDSNLDVIILRNRAVSNGFYVHTGNGDGTLNPHQSYIEPQPSDNTGGIRVGDFNGNGFVDVVYTTYDQREIRVRLNDGTGSFGPTQIYSLGEIVTGVEVGDFTNDGILDLVAVGSGGLKFLKGNGDGTFQDPIAFGGSTGNLIYKYDFNNDGNLDFIVGTGMVASGPTIRLGNGDGTFAPGINLTGSNTFLLEDVDGDGLPDLIQFDTNTMTVRFGLGGTEFGDPVETELVSSGGTRRLGDFNGNGIMDLAILNSSDGGVNVYFADVIPSLDLRDLSVATQQDARITLDRMKPVLESIAEELGSLGAQQSRADSAIRNIAIGRNAFLEAEDKIMSADIAEEAAKLVKLQILQQGSANLLSQVSLESQIVLKLLQG